MTWAGQAAPQELAVQEAQQEREALRVPGVLLVRVEPLVLVAQAGLPAPGVPEGLAAQVELAGLVVLAGLVGLVVRAELPGLVVLAGLPGLVVLAGLPGLAGLVVSLGRVALRCASTISVRLANR